jgi:dienelactone hydrolase
MSTFTIRNERETGDLVEVAFDVDAAGEAAPGVLFYVESEEPQPLVIIQHPATSSKDDYFVRDVAIAWARRGWACAGLDAPLHGERATYDPMSVLRDRERFGAISAQFAKEISAAIDGIAGHLDIDLGRLGYVGYSMGSMLGLGAVAADGRFKTAAFCLIGEGGMVGSASDAASPVQRLGNTAVRIVAKQQDEFFSKASTEALFNALPGETKDLLWLPGGHFEIGPDVIKGAEQWLQGTL